MKSVLEIMQYASAYAGSFLPAVISIARTLRAQQIRAVFVFPARARNREWMQMLRDEDIPVYFLPQGTLRTARFLRKLCRQYRVECVHTHFIDHEVYVPLRIACLLSRTPHVFHAHSLPRFPADGRLLPLRRALMHPAAVLCVSDAVRESYMQRGFAHCVTVVNGVDFARLDAGETATLPHPTALMFGYDFHIKGVDTALEAFAASDPQHRYTLAVCVASHRREAEEALHTRFGGVPDWVRLLPPRQDVGAYFRAADVFLSASRAEGLGNAVIEAAYCGKPIVLSDIPAHRMLSLPEAVFFPAEDKDALFAAVERAAAQPPSDRNRTFVCRQYGLDEWTRAVCDVLTAQMRPKKTGENDSQNDRNRTRKRKGRNRR